jgi:signal transduction histidine kinase
MRRMIPPRLEPRTLLTWLTWQSTLLVVVLFLAFKATERVVLGRHWYLFGRLDLAELLLLALLVGGFTWYVRQRVQRALDVVERQRQQAQALAAENAAVVRAVRAVVREFAQPLSGVLSYSELLLLRTERLAADERHEVTRLCEGVVRLERLLQTVRQTVDRAPSAATDAHVADVVERSIAPAHVQWPLHADRPDDSPPQTMSTPWCA